AWAAAGKTPPPQFVKEAARYRDDQEHSKERAQEKEKERDHRSQEAEHLLHRHHFYADAVALFQVSIALGAVAALSRSKLVWYASMAVGAGGMGLFFVTLASNM